MSSRWAASNIASAVLDPAAKKAAKVVAYYSAELVRFSILEMSSAKFERFKPAADAARTAEREEQADLLRDLVGNPYRPVRLDQAWLTPEVIRLAGEMYDRREFRTWVLADALEAAGCTEATVVSRCHELGEHFRGWWLVDSILGKA